jgi:hypothetical protein
MATKEEKHSGEKHGELFILVLTGVLMALIIFLVFVTQAR